MLLTALSALSARENFECRFAICNQDGSSFVCHIRLTLSSFSSNFLYVCIYYFALAAADGHTHTYDTKKADKPRIENCSGVVCAMCAMCE